MRVGNEHNASHAGCTKEWYNMKKPGKCGIILGKRNQVATREGHVGEYTHAEETSVDREMKGDGINEEREHHQL